MTIIPFPIEKTRKQNKLMKLEMCIECLKKGCPDIEKHEKGVIAMLTPIVDEEGRPYHAYITIDIKDLKALFNAPRINHFVDLAPYARLHKISEGLEPTADAISEYFNHYNSRAVPLH